MVLTPETVQGGQEAVPGYGCKTPPSRLVLPPWFPNWPLANRALWSGTSRSAGYELADHDWSEQRGTALEWAQQRQDRFHLTAMPSPCCGKRVFRTRRRSSHGTFRRASQTEKPGPQKKQQSQALAGPAPHHFGGGFRWSL